MPGRFSPVSYTHLDVYKRQGHTMRILISGAGMAGLSAGIDLTATGHDVTIVERASHLRVNGSPIDIRGESIGTAEKMGVLDRIRARRVDMSECVRFVGSHGEVLADIRENEIGDSDDDIEIPREDLADVLRTALPPSTPLRFGDSIAELADDGAGVDVVFTSGAREMCIRDSARIRQWPTSVVLIDAPSAVAGASAVATLIAAAVRDADNGHTALVVDDARLAQLAHAVRLPEDELTQPAAAAGGVGSRAWKLSGVAAAGVVLAVAAPAVACLLYTSRRAGPDGVSESGRGAAGAPRCATSPGGGHR